MDRAEAIKRLDLLLWLYDKEGQDKNYDAVKTAIAALREQEQKSPCSLCGYGGKHLDAPPCTKCPAHPKEHDCAKNAHCNEPLTLEELHQMDGEPAYCAEYDEWGIVNVESLWRGKDRPFLGRYSRGVSFNYDIEMRGLTLYRHKPKEGADHA